MFKESYNCRMVPVGEPVRTHDVELSDCNPLASQADNEEVCCGMHRMSVGLCSEGVDPQPSLMQYILKQGASNVLLEAGPVLAFDDH